MWEHTLRMLAAETSGDPLFRFAVLLHDIGKPATRDDQGHFYGHEKVGAEMAERICRRLKLTNRERQLVCWLVQDHMRFANLPQRPGRLARFVRQENFELLLELHRLDASCSNGDLTAYEQAKAALEQERRRGEFRPLVTGRDILALGVPEGPEIGRLLELAKTLQLEGMSREDILRQLERSRSL